MLHEKYSDDCGETQRGVKHHVSPIHGWMIRVNTVKPSDARMDNNKLPNSRAVTTLTRWQAGRPRPVASHRPALYVHLGEPNRDQ